MAVVYRMRRSPLVIGVVLAGLVFTLVAAAVIGNRADVNAEEWLAQRAEVVQSATRETVGDLAEGLQAVAAYMETSDRADQRAFTEFVSKLDGRISLVGVAYVPLVTAEELPEFIAEMRRTVPGFELNELDLTGAVTPTARSRDLYYPVQFFASGEFLSSAVAPEDGTPIDLAVGIDAGSNPEWEKGLRRAAVQDRPTVSDFIEVAFEDVVIGKAFVITVPVHDATGDVVAAVAAPMIDVLLPTELDVAIASEVTWEIGALETVETTATAAVWEGVVELPGVTWQLTVVPTEEAAAQLAGIPLWLVLGVGLLATLLLAATAELARQRATSRARLNELQRISEDKDRFLAAVSHEIRTPLTAVSGLAHELRDRHNDFGPEETHTLLGLVAEQSDEVSAIVEDLLVAARSDIGKVSVHAGVIEPNQEVEFAMASSAQAIPVVGESPPAWADAQRVRQILRNLFTNAARYGGPEVEVRLSQRAHWITIAVADNGTEIPESQQKKIFDPYTSAHENPQRVGSIGLGLFISRKLARVMGGDLTYSHDGQWSLFTLALPKVHPDGKGPVARLKTDLSRAKAQQDRSTTSVPEPTL